MVFDAVGRVTRVSDAAGNATRFTYNRIDQITVVIDAVGNRTEYAYDVDGNIVGVTDRLGNPTLYERDAAGQLTSTTDALNRTTHYGYDAAGQLVTVTDPKGNATSYGYDGAGRMTSVNDALGRVTGYGYDRAGKLTSVTNPAGNTTSYGYDGNGNRVSVTDPLGHTTSYSYDSANQLVTMTDANGNTTNYGYSALGELETVTDAAGNTTSYTYTTVGNLASVTDAKGNITHYAYDAASNLVEQRDAVDNITSYQVNTLGQVVRTTTAEGHRIDTSYTPLGDVAATNSTNGGDVHFEYDEEQRLIATSTPDGVTGFTYNRVGQLTSQIDQTGKTIDYGYDRAGQLKKLTLPSGAVRYTRDAAGQLSRLRSPWGSINYGYDAAGRVTALERSNDTTTVNSYDAAGQMTATQTTTPLPADGYTPPSVETKPLRTQGLCPVVTKENVRALKAANIDKDGCVKTSTYLARRTLPDQTALPTGATLGYTYSYDAVGNLTGTSRAATIEQNIDGGTTALATLDALEQDYGYNELNQLVASASSNGASNTYSYDAVGNRTGFEHVAATTASGVLDTALASITDADGTSQTRPKHASTATGVNGAADVSYTQQQVFNRLNQVTESSGGPQGDATYRYDRDGNRVSAASTQAGAASYSWNGYGQLTGLRDGDRSTQFGYDGLGRRVAESTSSAVGSSSVSTVWDGLAPVETLSSVAGVSALVRDLAGQFALQGSDTGGGVWPVLDRLGSVTAQIGDTGMASTGVSSTAVSGVDASSQFAQVASYDDWGMSAYSTSGWTAAAGFTGEVTDAAAGVNLFYARGYDTVTGSWLSRDAWTGDRSLPTTLNEYGYVLGNPVTSRDLLGYLPIGRYDFADRLTKPLTKSLMPPIPKVSTKAKPKSPLSTSRTQARHGTWSGLLPMAVTNALSNFVGWEQLSLLAKWATGTGNKVTYYGSSSTMTQSIKNNQSTSIYRQEVATAIRTGAEIKSGGYTADLASLDNKNFGRDVCTYLLWVGACFGNGDHTLATLGTYKLEATVVSAPGVNPATVQFTAKNDTNLGSGLGLNPEWRPWLDSLPGSSGPFSEVSQEFTWREEIGY